MAVVEIVFLLIVHLSVRKWESIQSSQEFQIKSQRDEALSEVQTLRMEKEFLMQQLKVLKNTVEHVEPDPPKPT